MRLRIILARPMHEINVGSVARAMKNFGQNELFLVCPRVRLGFQTMLFAKHAENVFENTRVVSSLEEATAGCGLVIGTTGVPTRYRQRSLKNCVSLKKAVDKAASSGARKIALVFGPEDEGLAEKEFQECDIIAFIPTSSAHSVLNLSHAVAIVLYEFFRGRKKSFFYPLASRKKTALLTKFFSEAVKKMRRVRDKRRVSLAFERVLRRAVPSESEVQALFAAFGELRRQLGEQG